ncbi:MAG: Hint domain-containing protein, partial [Paracoccaceae bacterium]
TNQALSRNDRITFDIGAGSQTTVFDAAVYYNGTLTYDNGSTWTGTLVIIQDTAGRTFLVPPPAAGAELTAMQANPIRSLTLNSVVNPTFSGLQQNRPSATFLTCFVKGTRILTAKGERAVETLRPGALVHTADDGLQKIRWVGRQEVPGTGRFAPVLIRAGALGNKRDLRVSPQHRMLVTGWQAELLFGEDEVLVPACHLVNDHSIHRAPVSWVTYHHILFDKHQIIEAEGCPSESFYPGALTMDRIDAATRDELLALFPGLRRVRGSYGTTARMVIEAGEARTLRARLALAGRRH